MIFHTAFFASLALASAFASTASAAIEKHSVAYSYSIADDDDALPRLNFPGFDSLGGKRTLTRVDVSVQAKVSATISIENMTDAKLDGWTVDADHTILAGFERTATEEFGPFAFLGGLSMEPFGTVLAARDNVDGEGADFYSVSDSTQIDSTLDMDPSYLDFFNGGGEVTAIVGPSAEFTLEGASQWNEFDGGDARLNFTELAQNGTFSVIYTFTEVPEPASLLALISLASIRRRR